MEGLSRKMLLIFASLTVAWTMAACCGALSEERVREQTAFARRAGVEQGIPVSADPPTMPPSQTATWTMSPSPSATRTLTPVPSATATPGEKPPSHTPVPSPTGTPLLTARPTRKLFVELMETYIAVPLTVTLNIPPDAQDLSLSCESSAAKMAAQYFKPTPPEGFTDWEWYFIKTIPRHCNPHRGYRGKIDGTMSLSCRDPEGYGTYAEPIAKALNKVGIPARVEYGVDYRRIAKEVRRGHPVIVWVSNRHDEPVREVDPETLTEYVLLLGEHVWLVVGVSADNTSFLVNDPSGGLQYWVKRFPRWEVFRGMSVIVGG